MFLGLGHSLAVDSTPKSCSKIRVGLLIADISASEMGVETLIL